MNALPSVDYDGAGEESLFGMWESGGATDMQAPLSVRRPRYRRLIVGILRRYAPEPTAHVLSIGAGNGFTEAELVAAGFNVLATDRSEIALRFCERKGLVTAKYEFPEEPPECLRGFDVVYCDGVLGHLWQPAAGCQEFWVKTTKFCHRDALMLLSNDLSETDAAPTLGVRRDPGAKFFRPPAGWFAQDAQASGLWRPGPARVLHYRRYSSPRRREILILSRSLVDKGVI
ncbi:MAG: class I SAM-dependent methyltransferase [Acidobacteriota bacterium]|nr:class I SAM-dependent methyltransferase [Acidobacteriota bacterium]